MRSTRWTRWTSPLLGAVELREDVGDHDHARDRLVGLDDDTGVTGYDVFRDGAKLGTIGGTAYTFSGLSCATRYALEVRARDAAGNVSEPATLSADTAACPQVGGLVAAYAFDEASGTAVRDASGHGNTGVLEGGSWSSGHSGSAAAFDGTSTWVTVADSASLDLTTEMTLEAWVKPLDGSSTGWRCVLNKEQTGDIVYALCPSSDTGVPVVAISRGAGQPEDVAKGTAALTAGAWSHLAATYDGTSLLLYVNGALAATAAPPGRCRPRRARCGWAATPSGESTSPASSTTCASTAGC